MYAEWVDPLGKNVLKVGTTLIEIECHDMRDAHQVIGLKPEAYTPVQIVPRTSFFSICCIPCCFIAIPHGFTALVSRCGRDLDGDMEDKTFSSGKHMMCCCCTRVSRLINQQAMVFSAPIKNVKTKDEIPVNLEVMIVFEISEGMKFAYGLGPEKLDTLLRAEQEETLRKLASDTLVSEIYDLHSADTSKYVAEMNGHMEGTGVSVLEFVITNVSIPQAMAEDFEATTLFESKTREQEMKQQQNKLLLECFEEKEKLKEKITNRKLEFEETMVTAQARLQKETNELKAVTRKEVALFNCDSREQVEDIQSTCDLHVAELEATTMKHTMELRITCDCQVGKLEAEASLYSSQKSCQAQLLVSEQLAEGRKALALSEGDATEAFLSRREQELKQADLDILEKLASNRNIHLVTSVENSLGLAPNNSLVTQMAQQGVEAVRMKLAQATSSASEKLEMRRVVAGGVVRPIPQQYQMI